MSLNGATGSCNRSSISSRGSILSLVDKRASVASVGDVETKMSARLRETEAALEKERKLREQEQMAHSRKVANLEAELRISRGNASSFIFFPFFFFLDVFCSGTECHVMQDQS